MKDRRKNRILSCTFLILLTCITTGTSQNNPARSFTVLFYNTENFFDCEDDTLKSDEEFLPGSDRKWTYSRYKNKVNKTAKVILASNGWEPPDIVGLCEIENDKVLNRLIWDTGLSEAGYRYVHYESPDKRGIDAALLYRKSKFRILKSCPVNVSIPEKGFFTRDILYVKGLVFDDDTFHILVCHMPSKYGGELSSEWKRNYVSTQIRKVCDSIFATGINSKVIILGDMNEPPDGNAIKNIIMPGTKAALINLATSCDYDNALGTIKYQGHWEVIDQIIISKSLREPPYQCDGMTIIDLPFLLEHDKSFSGKKPFRTFLGPVYHGGFSDHLPVKATISKQP